jgi:HAMP domain-containing protein
LALISWFATQSEKLFESIASGNFYLVVFFISELFVWLFIIYFLSIAIFLSLSLSSYVLNGIRKIPMNITPYDNFSLSKPLRVLESYSVNILLVSFIIILLILSMSQMIIEIRWVLVWFELALALLFIAVGLGSSRNEYIVGAILYLLILYGLENATRDIASLGMQIEKGVISTSLQIPIVDLRILVLGFFLTSALAFQLYSADQYVNNLLVKAKKSAIRIQRKQLEILQENLDLLNSSITQLNDKIHKQTSNTVTNKLINEYQSQRFSVLSSIDAAIKVIDHLEKIDVKKNPFSNITKVLTPLATSMFFAIIEKADFDFIFPSKTI